MTAPGATPTYRVEPLAKHHDRSDFQCGNAVLDRYLRQQAGQDARKRIAAPFVILEPGQTTVLGYYTLSATGIAIDDWPENIARQLPKYPLIPATLLGRLAVDQRYRGKGLGKLLLIDALYRSWHASTHIASFAVIVDAKDDYASAFYSHYQFIPLQEQPKRLFLPMKTLERLSARLF